jgi:hypothetical protein
MTLCTSADPVRPRVRRLLDEGAWRHRGVLADRERGEEWSMRSSPAASSLPLVGAAPLVPPTTLACLNCQLLGRRKLLCSRADACKDLPHFFALGPVLLTVWLATLVAFVVAVA